MPLEYVVPRNPVAILGWGLIFLLLAVLHLLAYIAASLTFWNGFLCYAILWIGPLFALLVSALMIGDGDTLNVPIGIIGGLGSFYIALLILWLTAGYFSIFGAEDSAVIERGMDTIHDVMRNSRNSFPSFLKISLCILVLSGLISSSDR